MLILSCSPLNPVAGMKDGYYVFDGLGEKVIADSLSTLGDTLYYEQKDATGKYGLFARDVNTKQETVLWRDVAIFQPVMIDAQQAMFRRRRPAEKAGAEATIELVRRNLSTNEETSLSPAEETVDNFLYDRAANSVYFLAGPPDGDKALYHLALAGGELRNLGPAVALYAIASQPAAAVVQRNLENGVELYLVPSGDGEAVRLWNETVGEDEEPTKRQKSLKKIIKNKYEAFAGAAVVGDRLLLSVGGKKPFQVIPLAGGDAAPWAGYRERDKLFPIGDEAFVERCDENDKQCLYLRLLPDLSSEPFCTLSGVKIRRAVPLSRGGLAALVIQDTDYNEKFDFMGDEVDFYLLGKSGAELLPLPARHVPREYIPWLPKLAELAAQNELTAATIRVDKGVLHFEIPGEGQGEYAPLIEKVHTLQKQVAALLGKPSIPVVVEYKDNGFRVEMEWNENVGRFYTFYGLYDVSFQDKSEYLISAYNKVTRTTYGLDFDHAYVTVAATVTNITDRPLTLKMTAFARGDLLSELMIVTKTVEEKKPLPPGEKRKITVKMGRLSNDYKKVGCYFVADDDKVDYYNEYSDQENKAWLETLVRIKEKTGFVFDFKDDLSIYYRGNAIFTHCFPWFNVSEAFVAQSEKEKLATLAEVSAELKTHGEKHLNLSFCGEHMYLHQKGKERWIYEGSKLTEEEEEE